MKSVQLLELWPLIVMIVSTNAYAGYQDKFPNGNNVPHSCKNNFIWKGVGHINQAGGGDRNVFGEDFAKAGHKWTVELCGKDSDGDGKTNGEELGDPDCVWQVGKAPSTDTGLSHPSICDPWGSPQCLQRNSWVNCDSDVFKCPAIEEEDVQKLELRYPRTPVPAQVTTYMCMIFELPDDEEYHMIAYEPIINESRVMHHLLMYGCVDEVNVQNEPVVCGMTEQGCESLIGAWAVGSPGQCLPVNTGYRIGKNNHRKVMIQIHWNNADKRSDLWDSSGLALHYTKKLRQYDNAMFMTGQVYLEIPPLMPKVVQQSTCSSRCTKKIIKKTANIINGFNHMHYLGIEQSVKLTRVDGTELMLTHDKPYSYDSPVTMNYNPPIQVNPGDSFETVCTFKSMNRKNTTFYGDATFDEMCFAFLVFYPKDAISTDCVTEQDLDLCDAREWNCSFGKMSNISHPDTQALMQKVMSKCSSTGNCLHGCRDLLTEIRQTNGCFQDDAKSRNMYRQILQKPYTDPQLALDAYKFVGAMRSCELETEVPLTYTYPDSQKEVGSGSDNNYFAFSLMLTGFIINFM